MDLIPGSAEDSGARPASRIGEIVEASTTSFTAQCYVLHDAPAFGSFVRAGDGETEVVAVIANARTGSIDPGRRPVARGRDEPDQEAIYRNNPELPEILRTEFTAQIVGYRAASGGFLQRLPKRPCRLHAFVFPCDAADVLDFTEELDFLQTLAAGGEAVADELVAACLRESASTRTNGRGYLVRAGKELAVLFGDDVNRLTGVLRRIRA